MNPGQEAPFAPYRVVRELARGGMGVVYEVVHEGTGGHYALKTLLEGVTPQDLLRFKREVEVLGAFDHPNVVKVHAARLDATPPYLVQDLLSGGSLAARLQRGPLPSEEAVAILAKLARGVAAGHALGILHRDLKPENVLFDERGEPRLVDFGLARVTQVERSRLTATGAIMGTPSYMAPEQVLDPRAVGTAADVYGLGALLYATLTGQPPFDGTLFAVLEAAVHRMPAAPSRINPHVPPAVAAECLRAMAKDPAERHANAEELAQALESSLRSGSPRSTRRVVALASGVVVALAVGVLLLATTGGEPSLSPAELTQRVGSLAANVERARAEGAYAECPRLRAEVDLLMGQEEPSAALRQTAREIALLEGLGYVLGGERDLAARRADSLGDSREGSLLRAAIVGTAEDTEPAAAVASLRKAVRGLGVPEVHLWLARARKRQGLDADVAGRVVKDLDAYEAAGGVLGGDDLLLHARALLEAGELERSHQALAKDPSAGPELRWRVALALVSRRLDRARQTFEEQRRPLEWQASGRSVALVTSREELNLEAARGAYGSVAEPLQGLAGGFFGEEREALARRALEVRAEDMPRARRATLAEAEIGWQRLRVVRSLIDRSWDRDQLDPFLKLYEYSVIDEVHYDSTLGLGELLWELGDQATRIVVGHHACRLAAIVAGPEPTQRLEPILRAGLAKEPDLRWRQRMAYVHALTLTRLPDPRWAEAEEIANRLLDEELDEELEDELRPATLVLRAGVRLRLGRTEEAVADFDRVIELFPEETLLWARRAVFLLEAGRTQQAVQDAKRFVESWTHMDSLEFRGAVEILWRHARDEHRALLETAIKTIIEGGAAVDRAAWRLRRGMLLLELDRDREARGELEIVIRVLGRGKLPAAKQLATKLQAGLARLEAGERDEAIRELSAAITEVQEAAISQD